ncbi:hypothetical protein BJX65DRAFT_312309 [Aspergillus insuetus]
MSVAFAQQGTLDWTSLGRMQFSASIAVLSRLSSAGIESLTLAFGQAMCTRISLGAHGEKFLMESLNRLKAFSSFGDVIWFGVGVRHVLRDIVQTAEGASLVALCASLSETYTNHVAALILYEVAKELKAASELSPSLTQWEALVRTSSCVFKETTFSLRVEKLLRVAGLSGSNLYLDAKDSESSPGHPRDMAQSIIALGDIMRGTAQQITVHGGRACYWLATYASLILGLRVQLAVDGEPLFTSAVPGQYHVLHLDKLPELERFKRIDRCQGPTTISEIAEMFWAASDALCDICECHQCKNHFGLESRRTMCRAIMAHTIISLAHLMERCHLNSNLRPKRFGLHSLYLEVAKRLVRVQGGEHRGFVRRDLSSVFDVTTYDLFSSYAAIFTGTRARDQFGSSTSQRATADGSTGGMYFFLDSVAGLSMSFTRASKVHVGSGAIECRSRLHNWVFDRTVIIPSETDTDYAAQEITCTTDLSTLQADLSSPSLTLEAVVEDTFSLVFYYRISATSQRMTIGPAQFAMRTLSRVAGNEAASKLISERESNEANALKDRTYRVVRGEGRVPGKGLFLRPHKGNLIAQCVAASWEPKHTVFVASEQELARILAWYIKMHQDGEGDMKRLGKLFIIFG